MGKNKNKDKGLEVPNPTSVANRDILQRLNFLYQASVLLNTLVLPHDPDNNLSPSMAPTDESPTTEKTAPPPHPKASKRKKKKSRVVSCGELSRSYAETMKSIGQKTNVRMDPSVKRRICKRCSAPLIPGISATVRIQDSASHGHLISYRCHNCQGERRIPAPPILRADPSQTANDAIQVQPAEVSTSTVPAVMPSTGGAVCPKHHKRKKRGPLPRLMPYFARDVGHVVFRGNERLDKIPNIP